MPMSKLLVHISYPKTGSSYMQVWFSQHPALKYSNKSVAGFHNAWEIETYSLDRENRHEYFVSKLSAIGWRGNVNIVGAKFNDFDVASYHETLCSTISKLFPGAKILIVTRGFSSMLRSLFSEYIVSGGILRFDEWYNANIKLISLMYNYDHLARVFQQAFGKENVILMPYELLRDEPLKYTVEIEKQLGLSQSFKLPERKINAAADVKYLEATLRISGLLHKMVKPLPYAVQKAAFGYYSQLLNRRKDNRVVNFIAGFLQRGIEIKIGEERLAPFIGKAGAFRKEDLYQPYLKEYLLM